MLKLDDTLVKRSIKGKRIHASKYYGTLILSAVFFIAWIVFYAIGIPSDALAFFGGFALLCFALPSARYYRTRTNCVLAKDKLYFFDAIIQIPKGNSGKTKIEDFSSGSLSYYDIVSMEFAESEHSSISLRGESVKDMVVIYGNGFSVLVTSGKRLIDEVRKKQEIFGIRSTDEIEFMPLSVEFSMSFWVDVISAFDDGKFEYTWDYGVELVSATRDFAGSEIDIILKKNDAEIAFNMDFDTIFTSYIDSEEDSEEEAYEMSNFKDVSDLIRYMRRKTEVL